VLALTQGTRLVHGQDGGNRWEMAIRPPAERLRPFVLDDYVGYTEWTPGPLRRREFPGPMVVVAIEFGPPIKIYDYGDERRWSRHRGGFVAGLDDRFAITEHDGFQHGLQVNLTPIGARLLFGVPMSELTGRIVPIRDVLPRKHRDLGDRLEERSDWDERFDLLEAVLGEVVAEAGVRTSVVSWAVRRIEESGGAINMRVLAEELGYSRKHVIELFRDQVGIPPKLLARIVRFDRLVRHLRRGGSGRWADLALEFGYYDQAHLVRDVRQFTGATPSQVRPTVADVYGLFG